MKIKQIVSESQLNEFAPANNPSGGNYLKALASAWYNGTFNTGNLDKGIKSQEDVERILERGIHCGDGRVRKYSIGYNADFDGVEIQSDDHYEYSDYDDAGNDIDSRTGKPWGPYDVVEFGGNELDESVAEGEVVAFPKKHRGDITNMHTCPKCGGDTHGGKYEGHQVQVCIPCKQVYLPPNSGIDQQGNKIENEDISRRGFLKGAGAAALGGAVGNADAVAMRMQGSSKSEKEKAAADKAREEEEKRKYQEIVQKYVKIISSGQPLPPKMQHSYDTMKDFRKDVDTALANIPGQPGRVDYEQRKNYHLMQKEGVNQQGNKISEDQLNEYLVKAGMPVEDVLTLNLFQDFDPEEGCTARSPEFAASKQWQQVVRKYAPIANMLEKKLLAQKRPLTDAEAEAVEETWYDGSDAYDDCEIEYLVNIYDQQIDTLEALLAGNLTDEEFGEGVAEGFYDFDDHYDAKQGGEYGKDLTYAHGGSYGPGAGRDDIFKGQASNLPADPFSRTSGAVPKADGSGRVHTIALPDEVDEGADERKQNALWAQITAHEKAAKQSKDLKRQHHLKMADQLRSQLKTSDNVAEAEQQKGADYRDPPEANYGDDYQAMVSRVKKLAGLGPLKTVYDPAKRVYKNMPTATQPKK